MFGEPIARARTGPRRADRRFGPRLKIAAHDPQRWKDSAYLSCSASSGSPGASIWLVAVGLRARQPHAARVVVGDAERRAVPVVRRSTPGRRRRRRRHRRRAARRSRCVLRGLALLQAHIARWLLAPSLAERVERLTETRAGAVDAATAELQRIERDLHDGAQARLVALAMDLGMAEERFDRDPESARELVGEAREEAKRALAELRDLARGIRPSLLDERGLGPAIAALAARSPVPATATVDVPRRPPAEVETAAWFVVSEALANTAKHSGAARADGVGDAARRQPARRGRRRRPRRRRPERRRPARARPARRGARRLARGPQPARRADGRASGPAVRVVIAEDLALLRDGLERLLRDSGFDVVAAVADGDALLAAVEETGPDVAIVDVRLPPAFRDEGVRAALELRRRRRRLPGADPLPVRRADLRRRAAGRRHRRRRLPAQGPRVGRARVRRGGPPRRRRRHGARPRGRLPARRRPRGSGPLSQLSTRERAVLALMAEGRTNHGIADELEITPSGVEKHVASIFAKLGLPPAESAHRRVLAVVAWLGG